MGGGNGHGVGDLAGPNHQGAFQDAGETQRVVHLVGEVTTPRSHDISPCFLGCIGIDLRNRVGTGKYDGLGCHGLDPFGLHHIGPGPRKTDQHICTLHGIHDVIYKIGICYLAQLPFSVETLVGTDVLAVQVKAAMRIKHDRICRVGTRSVDDARNGGITGACTIKHNLNIFHFLVHQLQRIDQPCQGYAGRPLCVIMPDRDFALLAQHIQHPVAVGLRDVFQVHRTKAVLYHFNKFNDFLGVVLSVLASAVNTQGHRIDAPQVFHQKSLSFHHAQPAGRRAVAITQHAGRIAHHRHQVAPVRKLIREVVVIANSG